MALEMDFPASKSLRQVPFKQQVTVTWYPVPGTEAGLVLAAVIGDQQRARIEPEGVQGL
jgi:hypothetical protein